MTQIEIRSITFEGPGAAAGAGAAAAGAAAGATMPACGFRVARAVQKEVFAKNIIHVMHKMEPNCIYGTVYLKVHMKWNFR